MSDKIALAAAFLVAACGSLLKPEPAPTDDPIRAPHAVHAKAKVECIACHESIYDRSAVPSPTSLPTEAKCLECHAETKEQKQCAMCHSDVTKSAQRLGHEQAAPGDGKSWIEPDPHINFAHDKHIDRVKEDCAVCHKSLPGDKANPVGALRVSMDTCRGCHVHEQDYQEGRCARCHTDLARYALAPIATFSHEGNFTAEHAKVARGAGAGAADCATCHERTFCADCHAKSAAPRIELKLPERVDLELIHRNDFLGRHAVEAAAEPAMCMRCHGTSFCSDCHTSEGVTSASPSPRDPHPPGFSTPSSPSFHGPEARRDIVTCAGCHDQGQRSVCVDCHKVGGIGGNPHPPGWTAKRTTSEARSTRMCLWCHG